MGIDNKLFFVGTTLSLIDLTNGKPEFRKFMLVECSQEKKVFQVVSVEGYKPGRICGYIDEDEIASKLNAKAVSSVALIKNLDNIFEYDKKSLSISEDHALPI